MAPEWSTTAARRNGILAAALTLFNEKGYEATTIDDVRQAAAASTGSIYHHFRNKQAIAAALFVEGLAAYQRELLEVFRENPRARDGVPAAVRHYVDWCMRNPALARFMLAGRDFEVREATTAAVREMNARFTAETAAWRARNVERGELRPLGGDAYLAIVYGPARALVRSWLAGRLSAPIEEATAEVASAAWRAVAPPGELP